jgi:diguanylate cyclase (GGDEF)-like protein
VTTENKLELLWEFGAKLHTIHNTKELIALSADTISTLLNSDRSSVFLYSSESNELWTIHADGIDEEIRVPAAKSVVGHAAITEEIQIVVDAYNDFRFHHHTDKATGYQTKNILAAPLYNAQSEVFGVVEVINKNEALFTTDDIKVLTLLGKFISYLLENRLYNEKMECLVNKRVDEIIELNKTLAQNVKDLTYISEHCPLTKVYNRVKLDQVLTNEIQSQDGDFSVILFDIDDFKLVNDNYGHLIGDEVLQAISRAFSDILDDSLYFGRWGGEEFLILMPNYSTKEAIQVAKELQSLLLTLKYTQMQEVITCSFGVVTRQNNESVRSLLKRVDDTMYSAKNSGKNSIEVN